MAKKRRPSTDDEADEASSDSEEEEADEAAADEEEEAEDTDANPYPTVIRRATHKKKKVLVLASRGVTSAYMELMEDIMKLMPHCRKDPKFDKKEPLTSIVEIAQLAACKLCLYFETRKMKDLYLWAGRCEGGPSVKFLVQQVRPMRDLRLTGNCLLGSRPILSFDNAFETSPTLSVLKSLLSDIFAPPKGHPRSKCATPMKRILRPCMPALALRTAPFALPRPAADPRGCDSRVCTTGRFSTTCSRFPPWRAASSSATTSSCPPTRACAATSRVWWR